MNKVHLFQNLKSEIDLQLKHAVDSVKITLDFATHEESKPENKYDTRGLEATYLARAQSERVLDLKDLRSIIENLKVRNFTAEQPIAITALVQLESNGKQLWALLLPKGGGQSFLYNDISVKVITPESPLGTQLIGKVVDDIVNIKDIEYLILAIF